MKETMHEYLSIILFSAITIVTGRPLLLFPLRTAQPFIPTTKIAVGIISMKGTALHGRRHRKIWEEGWS